MSELIRYLLIFFILLPGIVAVLLMASGSYFGRGGSFSLTTSSIGLACLVIGLTFILWIIPGSLLTYKYFFWINVGFCTVQWGFLIDSLSCLMLLIVSFISFLVHLYSIGYMYNDPHANRFMAYLSLFTFFMFMLVTSDNLLQLFLGWEGVGLCSYLLVSFWYTRINANKAAIKALVINRVGDIALLIAMAIVYHQFKTLNFAVIFSICHYFEGITYLYFNYEWHVLSLISICLFLGAVGKSAQLGLHTWLPDAMEGPTPVSALIHAATMVTAGVFLLIRCSPLLEYAPTVLVFIALSGALTTFFAASVGIVQTDIKKIIAYSTCSQLGYMILACGLSNYVLALYHLITHAFFKALLFLSAGSIIHATGDEQDYRRMGGLVSFLPITYSTMLIGSCAIMGMPYLAGYYSKDLILEVNFLHDNLFNNFLQPLLILSTMLTIIYSLKLLFQAFLTVSNSYKDVYLHIHEPKTISFLLIPLIILSFCSIFSGYFFQEIFSVVGNIFFNNVIMMKTITFEMEFFDWEFKLYIFWLTFFVIIWNVFYYIVFSSAANQAQRVVVKPLESVPTLINDFKILFSNKETFYVYNIKKSEGLPLINFWLEFYILRLLFLPISIGYKWFSKEITGIAYYHHGTNNTIIYSAEQVAFIIKRPIWQYQYPGFENKVLFFNFNLRRGFIYIACFIFFLDLIKIVVYFRKIIKQFLMALPNGFFLYPLGLFFDYYYIWRSGAVMKKIRSQPRLNIWYDWYVRRIFLCLPRLLNRQATHFRVRTSYMDRIIEYPVFTSSMGSVIFVKNPMQRHLSFFYNIKKSEGLPLINFWLEFYILRLLFLPISIGCKWFSKEITGIAYYHHGTNNTIIYSAEQVAFIIKRPIWQYQYPGFENKVLFFNVRVLSDYFPVKTGLSDQPLVWYSLFLEQLKNRFIYVLYTLLNLLILLGSGVIIKQLYHFCKIFLFEYLSLNIIYYLDQITNYTIYYLDQTTNVSFTGVIMPLTKQDWLVVPVEFIITNVEKKYDFFAKYKLEELRLSYYFRELILKYKIAKKLPLINFWLEFYILRLLFLPISIGYKWFSKEITGIAYYHHGTNNTIIYSAEQVAFIIKRPIWQYQYPGFENKVLFFNVRVSSWNEILEHVIELTMIELYNLLYCFSPEKYTFLQTLYFFTIQSESLYYFIGVIVINFKFAVWTAFRNLVPRYLKAVVLIVHFVLTNAYSFIICYVGWLILSMKFKFGTFYHRVPVIIDVIIYSIFFESYYRNQFLYSIISYVILYLYTVMLVGCALWDAIMRFACDFFSKIFYLQKNFISCVYFNIITFLSKKWFFDIFQNKVVYFILSKIYVYLYLLFEKGLFELFGPMGLLRFTTKVSNLVISMHKTKISYFTLFMFYSVIILYFIICYIQ